MLAGLAIALGGCAPNFGGDPVSGRDAASESGQRSAPGGTSGVGTAPGLPTGGNGRFAAAGAGDRTIGAGTHAVRFRAEVENGIAWRGNRAWRPADFAAEVDRILGAKNGWTRSAGSPVDSPEDNLFGASWSFRRVGGGDDYDVRIRLATPKTVDRLCGEAGMDTEGVYSCRFGETVMINLGRWLRGAPGYQVPIAAYRANVINHEVGHFLGFGHMTCGEPGQPAPVMQTQTIDLGGCKPNAYPFTKAGRFISGPHV